MNRFNLTFLRVVLLAGFGSATAVYADTYPLARQFDRSIAVTNAPIIATVTFTNGGTNTLRGFFYGDQAPSNLTVNPISVKIDGRTITNFVFEAGYPDDVYPGFTPMRWRLETPTNFASTNMLLTNSGVQITYSLTSSNAGSFTLPQYDAVAYAPIGSNSVFAYSQSSNQQVINFVTSILAPSLALRRSNGVFYVSLTGSTGLNYILDASSNLFNWSSIYTNTPPFSFSDTNVPTVIDSRYFRGRVFLGP
jgi:uncharacterized repeat protein (TIGR01451 family)